MISENCLILVLQEGVKILFVLVYDDSNNDDGSDANG